MLFVDLVRRHTSVKATYKTFAVYAYVHQLPPPPSYPVGQQPFAIQSQNGQKESFVINLGQHFQRGFCSL